MADVSLFVETHPQAPGNRRNDYIDAVIRPEMISSRTLSMRIGQCAYLTVVRLLHIEWKTMSLI